MFKLFSFGTLLGMIGTAALLHFVPVVDQHRERSIISVQPNGGNQEILHINLPVDRVMVGAPGNKNPVPATLRWPARPSLQGSQMEMFKLRDAEDRIIGVASRLAVGGARPYVEWTLHLPARGSAYLMLNAAPSESGGRKGRLRAGTREFQQLQGSVFERYEAAAERTDGITGRLELAMALVGPDFAFDPEDDEDEEAAQ